MAQLRGRIVMAVIPGMLGAYHLGPTFALTQTMASLRMRAMAASIMLFVTNLIGMGLRPQLTGIISDTLHGYTSLGDESLRRAPVAVLMVNIASTVCYLLAARALRADLARSID